MSSSFGYLIPKKTFEIGQFKKLITSILEAQEIIDGYYEEEYQWFAAGKNSHSIFKESNEDKNPAFEYAEFHDTVNKRIIPDCTEDNYGAKCNNCKTNLDDNLSDVLMDLSDVESESETETDMTQLTIECHNCNQTNKISDINFDLPVRFKNQFVCFVEIDSEFDEEKIKEVANKLDCTFEILYGRL
jgi:hypothetical protein